LTIDTLKYGEKGPWGKKGLGATAVSSVTDGVVDNTLSTKHH